MTPRERILAVLEGRTPDRLPLMAITMMLAADQTGVPYRLYATDHRVLADAQIVTARRFALDYVSCISDPTREAHDLGAAIKFFHDQPPAVDEARALLAEKSHLGRLRRRDLSALPTEETGGRMYDRVQAAALLKQQVGDFYFIEGWVEGPCAEGADLRGINNLMYDFIDDPPFVRDLFDFVVDLELAFARAQVQAGCDIIGIGDAAASLVGPRIYNEFVWPYEKRLVDGIRALGSRVRLHICGNTRPILEPMGRLGCDIVDLDFMVPLADARRAMGPHQVLLGNIDPVRILKDGTPRAVRDALAECHRQAGSRYILGAGCEVPRGTPPENFLAMADYARSAPVVPT